MKFVIKLEQIEELRMCTYAIIGKSEFAIICNEFELVKRPFKIIITILAVRTFTWQLIT